MTNPKRRRAYIGNLRPRPTLAQNLYNDLFVPHCLSINNYPNGDGITIVRPKIKTATVHAFVEFSDVDYAIQMLDGVQFDGKTLKVSREKTYSGGRMGSGFGSSRWAGADETRNRGRRGKKAAAPNPTRGNIANEKSTDCDLKTDEEVAEEVRQVISKEIADGPDQITSAIACTAAMSLLSSVDAFGLDRDEKTCVKNDESNKPSSDADNEGSMANQDFHSRRQLPLSELLNEYGEQDLEWKKNKQCTGASVEPSNDDISNVDFQSRCKMPLSELLAEYGEQDVEWKKCEPISKPATSVNGSRRKDFADKSNDKPIISDNGMLAPFGKAFIRLELVSFGYKYGAPPHSKKGFTYAHPLPPIDVRDLERAPANVAKFNGLSYLVKRALLNPSENNGDGNNVDSGEGKGQEMESDKRTPPTQSPMRRRANKIADEIIKVLVESIDEGGHGPISPLTMTISIGSEYGRHRAVVLVEHLAVILRARLRRNDGRGYNENEVVSTVQNGIVRQLVSVDTRHRDVDAHHMDEEAFGEDLKREVRAAEKARRRQERDDDHW
ncbi:hypothetical protein HJC23_004194 [Cyclotella cryptica]|uniref:RRM domain-containing protein n=1 Tax=Cyclotella cryptica TaxID=29204 RepID=A0ABD3Q8I5_9STRA|eukprot:CCRYP_007821-RA/>CCRYP_007821-RA protein AED:0.41 eAED:0.41 QI:0/-1/0/1/-1/1/1/0/552